jgi:hypothetical protein
MSDDADLGTATTEVIGAPEPLETSAPSMAGEFRIDVLLIGVVVLGAIIASNIFLRNRADSE